MKSPYVGIGVGLWYIVAPFVWGYPAGFLWWQAVVIGAAILAFSVSFTLGVNRLSGWLLIATGAYSMFAPFVHGYLSYSFGLWNDLVFGVITVGTGVAVAGAGLEYGGDRPASI
ncbi:MAG: hypothetical protein ACE5HQ_09475 [Gemmatimonadota bacterium]